MMTAHEIALILSEITYKPGWDWLLSKDGERDVIQISVGVESDATLDSHKRDGTRTPWKSGKRYLSPHMCRQEIVGVVFGLIKDAEMHEIHEWFRYKGASIYNPHLDPEVLVEVARKASSYNVRENAMSMEEPPHPLAQPMEMEISVSSELTLLEQLEWSAQRQGAPTGMGLNNGEWLQACPSCGGLRRNDGSFIESAVGHRSTCDLAAKLKELRK